MDIKKNGSSNLVSIIVPFLNGSHWLVEALQSILNQTFTNYEVIVIDDGSTELHSTVAKNFCRLHRKKFLYTEHEGHVNKGVTISRNEAAKKARGTYLAFLDADDVWMPNKLANQLKHFENYPQVQMVCESSVMWYSWNDKTAEDYVQLIGVAGGTCYAPRSLNKLLYPLQSTNPPAPSGIVITKKAFEKVGGFEPNFSGIYELYEDQAFLTKVYLHETVYISKTADLMYRKRTNSMSSAGLDVDRYYTVRGFYLNWLQQYVNKHNIQDKELNSLIEKAKRQMLVATQ